MDLIVSLVKQIEVILQEAQNAIENASKINDLDKIKQQFFSKKGVFNQLMQQLSQATPEDRPQIGKLINQAKNQVQDKLTNKINQLNEQLLANKIKQETIDITLSGNKSFVGSGHIVSLVKERISNWFGRFGFVMQDGPEIEDDFHNFTALNIPEHHPARAMQDTFYFDPQTVLRTHTSNIQIRTMEKIAPPLKIITAGRVYRSDSDMTHTPMFHQLEGLLVDEKCNFAELKGLIICFLKDFFDKEDLQVRFRPSFFPFTEPSAEVDIALGENGRWLEVLGCGMVHPNVLKNCQIDSQKYRGYAFGIGIERLAMLFYGVKDLRQFYENDVRFLRQFA